VLDLTFDPRRGSGGMRPEQNEKVADFNFAFDLALPPFAWGKIKNIGKEADAQCLKRLHV
jgi:hypothetical protein